VLFLVLPFFAGGCTRLGYEQMNDPARDAWQHPKDVIDAVKIEPGAVVADLGAGGGYFTFRLADAVGPDGRGYAVDVDEVSHRYIEEEAGRRGGMPRNVGLVLATPTDSRLPPGGVDLIFTCNTYHHLPDRQRYFASLQRALRPDGRVAIIDYKNEGWLARLFGHATDKETVQQDLERAGYRLRQTFEFLPRQHFEIFSVSN
jgi:predicted methyltransferase